MNITWWHKFSAPRTARADGRGDGRRAVDAGVFGRRSYEAVRKAFQRDSNAPSPVGKRGNAHTYDEDAIHEYASK